MTEEAQNIVIIVELIKNRSVGNLLSVKHGYGLSTLGDTVYVSSYCEQECAWCRALHSQVDSNSHIPGWLTHE